MFGAECVEGDGVVAAFDEVCYWGSWDCVAVGVVDGEFFADHLGCGWLACLSVGGCV